MKKIVTLSIALLYIFPSLCRVESARKLEQMVRILALNTSNAPKAIGPYSQAIKVKNAQETVYISGQLPINPETGDMESDPVKATEQCMKNLRAILKEAEMDFSNVVETTILLKNIEDFPVVNTAYASFLQEPYPARATFQAGALPKGAVVEIKMTAVK